MEIKKHSVGSNQDEFIDYVFHHLWRTELNIPRVYSDNYGIPTLGVGYALIVNAGGTDWEIRDYEQALDSIGITLTQDDINLLTSLRNNLNGNPSSNANKDLVYQAVASVTDLGVTRYAIDEPYINLFYGKDSNGTLIIESDDVSVNSFSFELADEDARALFNYIFDSKVGCAEVRSASIAKDALRKKTLSASYASLSLPERRLMRFLSQRVLRYGKSDCICGDMT